jgi:hypothetical protein
MIVWTAINSGAIVLVTLALYLTIRQVGLLLAHLGPGPARSGSQGPRIGENIASYVAALPRPAGPRPVRTLYIFATEFCPVCAVVREAARAIAKHWQKSARLVMVYDALSENKARPAGGPANFLVVAHATLRQQLDIRAVPYAVLTNADGVVQIHGLVNNASHLESLLEGKGDSDAGQELTAPGDQLPAITEKQPQEIHA